VPDDSRASGLVVWDALQVGRRRTVELLLPAIVRRAVRDLLERSRAYRHHPERWKHSVSEWVSRRDSAVMTLECLFCRAVRREARIHEPASGLELDPEPCSQDLHGEQCAAGVIAGMVTPREVAEVRTPCEPDLDRLPRQFELSGQGDPNYASSVTIWGEGFTKRRPRVWIAGRAAEIVEVVSDHQLRVRDPYAGSPGQGVDVKVRVAGKTTTLRQQLYYCTPSPY
jgi:hypothetical protein